MSCKNLVHFIIAKCKKYVQNVNTFMVNVGRFKRWTRASVYRMMPWQHPSVRKIIRKVFLEMWLYNSHNRVF